MVDRFAALRHVLIPVRFPSRSRLAISERRLLLALGDLFLILSSIGGSLWIWARRAGQSFDRSLWQEQALWALFIALGWVLWLIMSNLYDLRRAVNIRTITQRTLLGGLTIGLAYMLLFFLFSNVSHASPLPSFIVNLNGQLLRLAPTLAMVSSTILLLVWRLSYATILGGPHSRRRVLILGAGHAGSTVCEALLQDHSAHYTVLGFVDDHPTKQSASIHNTVVLGGHEQLVALAQAHRADEIVVAISAEVRGSLFQVIMDCHERGITVTPMPLLYERLTGRVPVEHIGSQWYVALPFEQHAASTLYRVLKRLGDLVAGLVFGALYLVVLPFVALAIKLDDGGPIFYSQERAGHHGRVVRVRKFRSMVPDAEQHGQARWAQKNDARVTRVGKILRKTRLDELPQLLNVLLGEMSMVGPRPERPQFVNKLQHTIPFYRTRLAAKPGLTGWAQINYGYGSTDEDALIKLQYDLYYIKHMSPWLDLLILLRTVSVVLGMKGQ